ncbi:MAG: class I SAM-dependent methyltransferase [Omnitrophica WOR_2 bacterium]
MSDQPLREKIELLSTRLLDEQRPIVEALKNLSSQLGIGLGWHYLLDLSWITSSLGQIQGLRMMDAGAGAGLMQWYLAGHGAQVISVDRNSRADLSLRFRAAYPVAGLRSGDLHPAASVLRRNVQSTAGIPAKARATLRGLAGLLESALPKNAAGKVFIYNADLKALREIPTGSLDAVVAVSALEHNPPEDLCLVVKELMRTLKPGRPLLATLCAAREQDWFHEPSKGWCYSESSLRRIFELPADTPSNYSHYDQLFKSLQQCTELHKGLAGFYFRSGDNGMPWGNWDPQYQPVGVMKVKDG